MANPWHIGNTTVRTPYRLRDALIALAHSEYHGNLVGKDPPPNLTRRYFTHASEHLIWAAKTKQSRHTFNYERLKTISNGETIKSVWRDIWKMPSVDHSEKVFGKHPTQKPEEVIKRTILASSNTGDLVFDPFCGSGTTRVVCKKQNRKFVGIDNDIEYLNIAQKRLASASNRNNGSFVKKLNV